MEVKLVTVGKTDVAWVKAGLDLYVSRLRHYVPFSLVEIPQLKNVSAFTEEQIKEMSNSGLVSIQSHTLSHGYLDEMYESQLHREHRDSMIALARITGKQPFVMCYPTGRSSGSTREITAQYYEYGLCMGGPCWVTGDAPYRIYRYYISRYTSVDSFLSYLAE
jgi:hypothetical protein